MAQAAIRAEGLGKRYKLFRRPADKVIDAFGLERWVFWRRIEYQEFWALRDLNLHIRPGERVGIIGRNGAGKSTLLKIISGNIKPTEGAVRVTGRIQALLELGTGFHPEFTGRENIRASLALNGMTSAEIREKEEEIVDFAELEEFIDQPIKTYSAGMYARLAFSAATAIEPEILIIDEVLGAGDAYFAGKCVERMKRLTRESGATVLFVSHDLSSVQALCERVVWIERGRVRHDGDPLEVVKSYSDTVRREEEARLRARDLKVRKKQAMLLDRHEDVYEKLLFHLVEAEGAAPPKGQRFFRIALRAGDREVGAVDVGAPMDNDDAHLHYLMDDPGYMDWSPVRKSAQGLCREYGDFGGVYRHAPFEFAVPRTYLVEADPRLRLEIEAELSTDRIAVEVYDGEGYFRLGTLDPAGRTHALEVPRRAFDRAAREAAPAEDAASPAAERAPEEPPPAGEYGSREIEITNVRLVDHRGEDARVLYVDRPGRVEIEYAARREVLNPIFVFCAYLPDGRCATQWLQSSEEMGRSRLGGRGRIVFELERLVLGRGAYVASAAIFKFLRGDGGEAESYHVIDRSIHFQVLQEFEAAHELGLCVQPFAARIEDAR